MNEFNLKKLAINDNHLTTTLENYTLFHQNLCFIHGSKSNFVRRTSWWNSKAPSICALLIRLFFRYDDLDRKSIVVDGEQKLITLQIDFKFYSQVNQIHTLRYVCKRLVHLNWFHRCTVDWILHCILQTEVPATNKM